MDEILDAVMVVGDVIYPGHGNDMLHSLLPVLQKKKLETGLLTIYIHGKLSEMRPRNLLYEQVQTTLPL